MTTDNIVGLSAAALLVVYLVFCLMFPERF
ncbi:potassium-transporting ATPase subunit F [Streptomyces sp. NPDC087420]